MHPHAMSAAAVDISSSAGACQRFTSHLQLHLSTVTVLLAAAWALLSHAAGSMLACIASGLSNHTAAAKAHLLMLKQSSPSRLFKKAAAQAATAAAAPQHMAGQQLSCSAAACPAVLSNPSGPTPFKLPAQDWDLCKAQTASTTAGHAAAVPTVAHASTAGFLHRRPHAKKAGKFVLQNSQHAQHSPAPAAACATTISHPSTASAGNHCAGMVVRIPMQLQDHRGRLTIALDLDETLLCTYRIQHCAAKGDTLQLVPSNRPGAGPCASSSSGGSSRWPSLLGRSSTGGSNSASSNSTSSSSFMGSFSIDRQCPDLPGDLGAASRASAWMHYRPPASSLPRSRSGSCSGDPSSSEGCSQQQQQLPGAHTLAVFLRPGCLEFLGQLSCFAEVVLFTAASPEYGTPLAQLLDPDGKLFRGRLFGDACVQHAGRRGVKDLQVCHKGGIHWRGMCVRRLSVCIRFECWGVEGAAAAFCRGGTPALHLKYIAATDEASRP
jgi:hypothetical protein